MRYVPLLYRLPQRLRAVPTEPVQFVRPARSSAVLGVVGDAIPAGERHLLPAAPRARVRPAAAEGATDVPGGAWLGLSVQAPSKSSPSRACATSRWTPGFSSASSTTATPRVDGQWTSPTFVLRPADSGWRCWRTTAPIWSAWVRAGCRAEAERWWLEPMFCGWGAQCARVLRPSGIWTKRRHGSGGAEPAGRCRADGQGTVVGRRFREAGRLRRVPRHPVGERRASGHHRYRRPLAEGIRNGDPRPGALAGPQAVGSRTATPTARRCCCGGRPGIRPGSRSRSASWMPRARPSLPTRPTRLPRRVADRARPALERWAGCRRFQGRLHSARSERAHARRDADGAWGIAGLHLLLSTLYRAAKAGEARRARRDAHGPSVVRRRVRHGPPQRRAEARRPRAARLGRRPTDRPSRDSERVRFPVMASTPTSGRSRAGPSGSSTPNCSTARGARPLLRGVDRPIGREDPPGRPGADREPAGARTARR